MILEIRLFWPSERALSFPTIEKCIKEQVKHICYRSLNSCPCQHSSKLLLHAIKHFTGILLRTFCLVIRAKYVICRLGVRHEFESCWWTKILVFKWRRVEGQVHYLSSIKPCVHSLPWKSLSYKSVCRSPSLRFHGYHPSQTEEYLECGGYWLTCGIECLLLSSKMNFIFLLKNYSRVQKLAYEVGSAYLAGHYTELLAHFLILKKNPHIESFWKRILQKLAHSY